MIDYTGDQMKGLDQYLSGASAVMKGFLTIARGVPQGWVTAGH
jgi:hypothetical protein